MKPMSKGTTTTSGYIVEIRTKYFHPSAPVIVSGMMVTDSWQAVQFSKGHNPAGVPADNPFGHHLSDHGLLPYESAVALAYVLHAQQRRHGLQTRLIKHACSFTHEINQLGVVRGSLVEENLCNEIEVEPPRSAAGETKKEET